MYYNVTPAAVVVTLTPASHTVLFSPSFHFVIQSFYISTLCSLTYWQRHLINHRERKK